MVKQEYNKMIKESEKHVSMIEKQLKNQHEKREQERDKKLKLAEKELKASHKKELAEKSKHIQQLKNQHEKREQERDKKLKLAEKELKASHKKELAEKSKHIQQLKNEHESIRKEARNNMKEKFDLIEKKLRTDLKEKDIQIERVNKELEDLRISKTQSELKGEVGELDLYATLTHAFTNDFFRRQKRGTSSGDLIQQIRTSTGSLDTPIVYDNKSAITVSKTDIEKAKKYKKIHATNYVIIVSNNLPKKSVPNGLYGENNGIILVHPKIITEVVKHIRNGIIEISKLSNSKKDQQAKQYKLYEYVISNEFSMMLNSFYKTNEDMFNLQTKEEKDHETLWKTRKSLHTQLQKTINDLSSGIESITQKEVILEKY